jgi:hypothetical protein
MGWCGDKCASDNTVHPLHQYSTQRRKRRLCMRTRAHKVQRQGRPPDSHDNIQQRLPASTSGKRARIRQACWLAPGAD